MEPSRTKPPRLRARRRGTSQQPPRREAATARTVSGRECRSAHANSRRDTDCWQPPISPVNPPHCLASPWVEPWSGYAVTGALRFTPDAVAHLWPKRPRENLSEPDAASVRTAYQCGFDHSPTLLASAVRTPWRFKSSHPHCQIKRLGSSRRAFNESSSLKRFPRSRGATALLVTREAFSERVARSPVSRSPRRPSARRRQACCGSGCARSRRARVGRGGFPGFAPRGRA